MGRKLSVEDKVARLVGSPLSLIFDGRQGSGVLEPHAFECLPCRGTFERSFSKVDNGKQGCRTRGCFNYFAKTDKRGVFGPREGTYESIVDACERRGSELVTPREEYRGTNTKVTVLCADCREPFERNGSYFLLHDFPIRCKTCFGLSRKGEGNPAWAGPSDTDRKALYRELCRQGGFYDRVREMHGYRCVITGEGGKIAAHHMDSISLFPESALNVQIGVPIVRRLHVGPGSFHERFGYRNTAEQFAEFFREKTGRDFAELYHLGDRRWLACGS